jgi:hypothetical protein
MTQKQHKNYQNNHIGDRDSYQFVIEQLDLLRDEHFCGLVVDVLRNLHIFDYHDHHVLILGGPWVREVCKVKKRWGWREGGWLLLGSLEKFFLLDEFGEESVFLDFFGAVRVQQLEALVFYESVLRDFSAIESELLRYVDKVSKLLKEVDICEPLISFVKLIDYLS